LNKHQIKQYATSKQYSIGEPDIAFFFGPSNGSSTVAASEIPDRGMLAEDIFTELGFERIDDALR
jgi:hypothetical protein